MVVCPYCIENNKVTLTNDCKTFFIATESFYQVIINTKKKNRKDFIKDKTEKDVAPSDC